MSMEVGKSYHMAMPLEHVMEQAKYMMVMDNGVERPATVQEVRAAIDDARSKGYQFLPTCDNVDATGKCAGHPVAPGERAPARDVMDMDLGEAIGKLGEELRGAGVPVPKQLSRDPLKAAKQLANVEAGFIRKRRGGR